MAQGPVFTNFLPLIRNSFPLQTVFGMGMDSVSDSNGLSQMAQVPINWVRGIAVPWSAVEPTPGVRNWSALSTASRAQSLGQPGQTSRPLSVLSVEEQLRNAANANMTPIVVVDSTPTWAQRESGYYCGPIKQEYMGAFGTFMHDLVQRYSVPPYNVKYWEIWNEPDIDWRVGISPTSQYGCWGNKDDPYYGGGYYALALQSAYPQIKSADPRAQVLVGGLLLDCDPVHPPAGLDCTPSKYLEGILRNGGASYFDGVSFHAYDYYYYTSGTFANPNWNSASNTTGPVGIVKSNYLKSVLNSYGASGKFLLNTESALLCDVNCDSTFEVHKAYYVAQAYASAIAQGIRGNLWYSVLGWRNSAILNSDLSPTPAYTAVQVSRRELAASTLIGNISSADVGATGVTGYKFNRGDRRVWLVWSLDGAWHVITPNPGIPAAVWDSLGTSIAPSASLSVGLNPIYLEWNP